MYIDMSIQAMAVIAITLVTLAFIKYGLGGKKGE